MGAEQGFSLVPLCHAAWSANALPPFSETLASSQDSVRACGRDARVHLVSRTPCGESPTQNSLLSSLDGKPSLCNVCSPQHTREIPSPVCGQQAQPWVYPAMAVCQQGYEQPLTRVQRPRAREEPRPTCLRGTIAGQERDLIPWDMRDDRGLTCRTALTWEGVVSLRMDWSQVSGSCQPAIVFLT